MTKTYLCNVSYRFGYFVSTVTVTSPKTGRTISVKEGDWRFCRSVVEKIQRAIPEGGTSQVLLTASDLKEVLGAMEVAREDYKESLNRDSDGCIASEETDGECPHCDSK